MEEAAAATELTATQFVILAENQRKKKALADTKGQFIKVADENKALTKQLEDTQQENYEVTEHLRRELLLKTQKIAELQAQATQTAQEHAAEITRLEELAADREKQLQRDANTHAAALQDQIKQLQATLDSVAEFRTRQVEVEEELLRVKEEAQSLREQLDTQRTELERYYLELSTKQRKEWEQRLEEMNKANEDQVNERLDASVKRILQHNRRMAEELKIHVQETEVLSQEVRILEEERARLMREVTLKTELEEGYAKRGAQQNTALKAANGKIAALEASLAQMMADFAKDRQNLLQTAGTQVGDAQSEVEALRRLIKLKTRELKNIRRLAQEVLLQRSDVETFLLSSLHVVHKEMERDSFKARAGLGSETSTASQTQQAQAGSSGRLDIKDLGWEDRERVLRLLFAKINNQAQQQHYAHLPVHPLAATAASKP